MRLSPSFAVIALCTPLLAHAHPLGDAALEMEPGQWRTLATENMSATLDTSFGGVPEFGDSGAWDPERERFFIHGQGHEGGTGQFRVVHYDAEENRWDVLPQPGWYDGYTHQISHPYDHNAFDPQTGTYYLRPFQWNRVYGYDVAAAQWSTLPSILDWTEYASCCGGLVHFPEMGGLVLVASGNVVAFDYASQAWSDLGGASMGSYHNFAEYSPGVGAVLLGGGPGDGGDPGATQIHRLDADGTVTPLGDAPVALGTTESVVVADPVSGVFLVLSHAGVLHAYDMATDTWSVASDSAPLPVFNTVAAPVADHGVVFFANWDTGEDGTVVLYKMSPFTPPPDDDTGGDDADADTTGDLDGTGAPPGDELDGDAGDVSGTTTGANTSPVDDGDEGAGPSVDSTGDSAAALGGEAGSGCGCRSRPRPAGGVLGFLLLGLLRRRR